MNKIFLSLVALVFCSANVDACVTYSPSTGTYTVDKSGCVDHGGAKQKQPKQTKQDKPAKGKKK